MRVLVDSDVIVAVMDGTEAQSDSSKAFLDIALKGGFIAVITPLIAANVMYALRRKWRTTKPKTWQADINQVMAAMLSTLRMIPVDERDFLASLASAFIDKEDGIQHFAAVRHGKVDAIVTCNAKDYALGSIPALEPAEFIAQHEG
ncbi:MAG: PIN domain-containing protein [Flavobacteriales bacterium]